MVEVFTDADGNISLSLGASVFSPKTLQRVLPGTGSFGYVTLRYGSCRLRVTRNFSVPLGSIKYLCVPLVLVLVGRSLKVHSHTILFSCFVRSVSVV